jgi:hypothetical protein
MAEISHLLRSGGITCARVATLSVSSRAEALAKTGEVFPRTATYIIRVCWMKSIQSIPANKSVTNAAENNIRYNSSRR